MIPVAHDVQGLDLAAIEARHVRYRRRDEQETHHTSPTLVVAAIASAEDVPTLLAEVERLSKELADERTQHRQTVHERDRYKQLYETLCTELQAATARVDTARAEGQASAYQDAADRVARMRWENPGFFWNTYLSISDTLRDLAEQARKDAYAPDTESPDDDV